MKDEYIVATLDRSLVEGAHRYDVAPAAVVTSESGDRIGRVERKTSVGVAFLWAKRS